MSSRARGVLVAGALVALGSLLGGCGSGGPLPQPAAPRFAEWQRARTRRAELRHGALGDTGPRTLRLRVGLRAPLGGAWMEARGGAAILPPDALRMILLGPGGTTALDLWMRGEHERVAVPAADLVHRSDRPGAAPLPGLPFAFLRSWLVRPLAGTLLWYDAGPGPERFVLRDGAAIVDLTVRDTGAVSLRRDTWADCGGAPSEPCRRVDVERVEATALGCAKARYTQESTGLTVEVTCEGIEPRPPSPRAFLDPDGPEAAP